MKFCAGCCYHSPLRSRVVGGVPMYGAVTTVHRYRSPHAPTPHSLPDRRHSTGEVQVRYTARLGGKCTANVIVNSCVGNRIRTGRIAPWAHVAMRTCADRMRQPTSVPSPHMPCGHGMAHTSHMLHMHTTPIPMGTEEPHRHAHCLAGGAPCARPVASCACHALPHA